MKKTFIWILIFCLILIGIDLVFGFGTRILMAHSGFRFARAYCGESCDADVLLIGNSRAVNAFDSKAMGAQLQMTCFNLGYNGMGPRLIEATLFDYLDSHRAPKVVVLEVSNIWQDIGPIRDLRLFSRCSDRLSVLDQQNDQAIAMLAKHSYLFSANGEILFRVINYLGKDDQGWCNSGIMAEDKKEELIQIASKSVKDVTPVASAEAYQRIFARLDSQGIKSCAVVTPYMLDEAAHSRLLNCIKRSLPEGVSLIDHVMAIPYEASNFADPLHLNLVGRSAYTPIIGESVKRLVIGTPLNGDSKAK